MYLEIYQYEEQAVASIEGKLKCGQIDPVQHSSKQTRESQCGRF